MREQAIFAGGCFWCTEAIFQSIDGVLSVESGYIGGHLPSPTYDEVYSETTGHAEAVKIEFDPAIVSYDDLLDIHFATHDATQENIKEGVVRSRYRSALFPTSDAQRLAADKVLSEQPLNSVNRWLRASNHWLNGMRQKIITRTSGRKKDRKTPSV